MNRHEEKHRLVEQSITEALFHLMDQKPFSEITVSELVNRAGVARATYYRNYSSKEEILIQYINHILNAFNQEFPVRKISERFTDYHIMHVMDYVDRYRPLAAILAKSGLSSIYLDCLNRYMMKLHKNDIRSENDIYSLYAFAGAEFNLVFYCLVSDYNVDARTMASQISKIFSEQEF